MYDISQIYISFIQVTESICSFHIGNKNKVWPPKLHLQMPCVIQKGMADIHIFSVTKKGADGKELQPIHLGRRRKKTHYASHDGNSSNYR